MLRDLVAFTGVSTVDQLPEATWPEGEHPQILHLDAPVPSVAALNAQHERVLALEAVLARPQDDPEEPLRFIGIRPATRSACVSTVDPDGTQLTDPPPAHTDVIGPNLKARRARIPQNSHAAEWIPAVAVAGRIEAIRASCGA